MWKDVKGFFNDPSSFRWVATRTPPVPPWTSSWSFRTAKPETNVVQEVKISGMSWMCSALQCMWKFWRKLNIVKPRSLVQHSPTQSRGDCVSGFRCLLRSHQPRARTDRRAVEGWFVSLRCGQSIDPRGLWVSLVKPSWVWWDQLVLHAKQWCFPAGQARSIKLLRRYPKRIQ